MSRHFNRGRVAKPYCEAFPCLKLAEVIAEWSAGGRVCEWTNEQGVVVGHVTLVDVTAESITFDYLFLGTVNVAARAGRETIQLQPINQGSARRKPSLICPVDGRPVGCIYFVDRHWAGKTSHRLIYLSQRLDTVTKFIVSRDKLGKRVRFGRDAFGSATELARAKREIADLNSVLADNGVKELATRLSYRAFPRWLGAGEVAKTAVSDEEEGYRWVPGQPRGFERFYVDRVTLATPSGRTDNR